MLSEWCRAKYDAALERGDAQAAADYQSLYSFWLEKGM